MNRAWVTVAAVAATAVVGVSVPLAVSLTASGTEQAPAAAEKAEGNGPPPWAKQSPGPERDAARAQWKKDRRAHLDAWKAWKKEQQKAWRTDDTHDGPPPWAGGPWKTGPGTR